MKYYSFDRTAVRLLGLSSIDGSRLYINDTQLKLYQKSKDDEEKMTYFMRLQRIVEHESMHNLSRFLGTYHIFGNLDFCDPVFIYLLDLIENQSNMDRAKISPEKNINLRYKNEMIEAGSYYARKVYNDDSDTSAFCLLTPKRKLIF